MATAAVAIAATPSHDPSTLTLLRLLLSFCADLDATDAFKPAPALMAASLGMAGILDARAANGSTTTEKKGRRLITGHT